MREELRQRLFKEYSYAVAKMEEAPQPAKKLFYFSVFFGEAQRVLNFEWNTDLALIYTITNHVHTQITSQQASGMVQQLPVDLNAVYDKLTRVASKLASYFGKNDVSREELLQILGELAEIAYAVSGNGSYLYERGLINL